MCVCVCVCEAEEMMRSTVKDVSNLDQWTVDCTKFTASHVSFYFSVAIMYQTEYESRQ